MMRPWRQTGAAAAVWLLCAGQPRAEFFWRFPAGRGEEALRSLGGASLYRTAAQINGAAGTLAAYAFAEAPGTVAAGLARLWSLPAPDPFGASMITHTDSHTLYRLLIMPPADNGAGCVALALLQPLREAARARNAPDWPAGWPALNATPLFTASCELTRATFVTADSPAPPEVALLEAKLCFRQQGWSETLPASSADFAVLAKGRKHCIIFAAADRATGRTAISLLQREGATP